MESSTPASAVQHRASSGQPGPSGGHTLRPSTVMETLPSPWPLPSSLDSLNAFGESFASRRSFVPTGLAEALSLAAPPADGAGGDDGAGLAAGGDDGAGLTAGRVGSGDLAAHAHASNTAATPVARIDNIIIKGR